MGVRGEAARPSCEAARGGGRATAAAGGGGWGVLGVRAASVQAIAVATGVGAGVGGVERRKKAVQRRGCHTLTRGTRLQSWEDAQGCLITNIGFLRCTASCRDRWMPRSRPVAPSPRAFDAAFDQTVLVCGVWKGGVGVLVLIRERHNGPGHGAAADTCTLRHRRLLRCRSATQAWRAIGVYTRGQRALVLPRCHVRERKGDGCL